MPQHSSQHLLQSDLGQIWSITNWLCLICLTDWLLISKSYFINALLQSMWLVLCLFVGKLKSVQTFHMFCMVLLFTEICFVVFKPIFAFAMFLWLFTNNMITWCVLFIDELTTLAGTPLAGFSGSLPECSLNVGIFTFLRHNLITFLLSLCLCFHRKLTKT